jgi:uncharacterized membrane protein
MLQFIALIGIIITSYAIYVEHNAKKGRKFMCDINDYMSCSAVLTSPYARMIKLVFGLDDNHILNVPNTYVGILFYLAVLVYPYVRIPYQEYMLLLASILSLFACVVLALAMYKLGDTCIVCIATYFVNMAIFYYAMTNLPN